MSAKPANDTNALLLQLVTGGNDTIQSADDLPSATFTPSPGIFPVNILFSLSLTLAIISSFLAVLGQQWLIYYRKRSGGGPEYQRWEQLRRYLGAKRWRLELILDDVLPALLQLGLVVFCIAFVLYLRTMSKTIYYVITTPMVTAMAILFLMAIMASLDPSCPFQSPSSHFFQLIIQEVGKHKLLQSPLTMVFRYVGGMVACIIILAIRLTRNATIFISRAWSRSRRDSTLLSVGIDVWEMAFKGVSDAIASIPRPAEKPTELRVVAAKRVLCTSEDFNTLVYTGINLLAIKEKESAREILDDDAVHQRLGELIENPEKALVSVFSRAYIYLLLGTQSAELFVEQDHRQLYSSTVPSHRTPLHIDASHPLKTKVTTLRLKLKQSTGSLETDGNRALLFYAELLHNMLVENIGSVSDQSQFYHVTKGPQAPECWAPLFIWLVATTIRVQNERVKLPGHQFTSQEQEQEGHFQQVEAVKKLVGSVGWGMRSFPAAEQKQ